MQQFVSARLFIPRVWADVNLSGNRMIMLSDDRDYAQTDVGDDNVDAVGMGGLSGTCIAANQFGGCV